MGNVRVCAFCVVLTEDESLAAGARARGRWGRCMVVACGPSLLPGFVRSFYIDHVVVDDRYLAADTLLALPPSARVEHGATFDAVMRHVDEIVAEGSTR